MASAARVFSALVCTATELAYDDWLVVREISLDEVHRVVPGSYELDARAQQGRGQHIS